MMKPILLISAGILFASIAMPVPPAAPQNTATGAKALTAPTPEAQARAKKIYQRDCAMCHGDTGDGQTDMAKEMVLKLADWTDPKSLANKSDRDLFAVIRSGKGKMLQEDEDRASDEEVRNIILYIRGFSKTPPAADSPAAR